MGGEGLGRDGPGGDDPPVDEADRTDGNDAPDSTADRSDQSAAGPDSDAGIDSEPTESAAGSGIGVQADDVDRTTVRITSDIGDILGVDDREYTLSSDDVVTLPEQNAAPSSIGRRPSASSERASSPIVINGFVSTTRCSRTAV